MKRHHGCGSSHKAFNWELAYGYRDLVHYHHGGEHSGMQSDMVAESSISASEGSRRDIGLGLSF